MPLKYILLPVGLLSLAACGGGGGGGGEPIQTYAEMFETGQRIFEEVDGQDWTTQSQIPQSGDVRYDGVFITELDAGDDGFALVQGRIRLDADFDDDEVSGSIRNIADGNDDRLVGVLDITNGVIARDVNPSQVFVISADVDGNLLTPDDTTAVVDAELFANFVGPEAENVFGRLFGSVSDGGTTAFITNSTVVLEQTDPLP